jgi:transposase
MRQKYHINLSEEERGAIEKYCRSKRHSEQSRRRAKVILNLDESEGKSPDMAKVAERFHLDYETVWGLRRKYETKGLGAILSRKKREVPPVPAKVTGEVEAHIIAVCCSSAPEGKSKWTLKMIANKIVIDGVIDSISSETVRKVLKKHNLNHI